MRGFIKTFNKTWSRSPKGCIHEWRTFGTRSYEEVYVPVRTDDKPEGYHGGWVICNNCGWTPHVNRYEIVCKQTCNDPFFGPKWRDTMVKIIEWGSEKEEPTKPIIETFSYVEYSIWDKLKNKLKMLKNWILI